MVGFSIQPSAVTASTQTATVFGASLSKGDNVGMTALPLHWHLSINQKFARLDDFKSIGVDLWDITTGAGKPMRIENPGTQEGKKYIEKEMLLWMGCFMPIYSDGAVGLRRLSGVLSDAGYVDVLDESNIVSYGALTHDMRQVINDIRVDWNYSDQKETFTKKSVFLDADSISAHGEAPTKEFKFRGVHTGIHTDRSLQAYFDVLRDRYNSPPLLLTLGLLPGKAVLEVGDVVRVILDQIRDMNTGLTLNRAFEVQQVTTNWTTGAMSVKLFGSANKAGSITSSTSAVLLDSFYSQAGTELSTVLTIVGGHVTVGGTLTGHATDVDDATAIYYYVGDLIIDAGVVINTTQNVQLRIMGALENNGSITGIGGGTVGGAATTLFKNGSTTHIVTDLYEEHGIPDYHNGEDGYYGTTIPPAGFGSWTTFGAALPTADAYVTMPDAFYKYGTVETQWGVPIVQADPFVMSSVPFFSLDNDQQTNVVMGYPKDLRGQSGISGVPFIHSYNPSSYQKYLLANGGVGGNGGAGLLIIARGMSFSGSGNINLSGGDSTIGASYTVAGNKFYAGAGAPGAPGVLVVLSDGPTTPPDISTVRFTAKYGTYTIPAGATEVDYADWPANAGIYKYIQFGAWPFGDAVPNRSQYGAGIVRNIEASASAHRFQYLPKDETPQLAAQDHSLFSKIGGWGYTETNVISEATPITSGLYGTNARGTDDGSRMVVRDGASGQLHVIRNIDNELREATFADTCSSYFRLDAAGDRVAFGNGGYNGPGTATGRADVYKRTGVTWALEQYIDTPTPGTGFGQFGNGISMDAAGGKLLVHGNQNGGVANRLEYWTRSGTVWSYIGLVPNITAYHAGNSADVFHISGDGMWCVAGKWLTGGSPSGQAITVCKLVGTTWTHVVDLEETGYGSLGVSINYDGSVITAQGNLGTAGLSIYHRDGDNFSLIGIVHSPVASYNGFANNVSISDDGLRILVYDIINEFHYLYRRSDVRQSFSDFINIPILDGIYTSTQTKSSLSRSGKIAFISDYDATVNALANAGWVHIWKTISD